MQRGRKRRMMFAHVYGNIVIDISLVLVKLWIMWHSAYRYMR